ncbi:MAG TPA: hydroxymethylglutaryl-CoA lyase [Desulfobacteraceae bacterium]|nr:hydroxymethylglutaryl-CoA lyase [Desulfobacteraceae bacterium]
MIRIVEVGPRDGLQNERADIPAPAKIAFVDALSRTGVAEIEVSAFVSAKMIPRLRDAATVFKGIRRKKDVIYSALVPNMKGLDQAVAAGADKISVFTAASETFNHKNINTGIEGSLTRFRPVVRQAIKLGLPVRGYVSTAFWCAYEGRISPGIVLDLSLKLLDMGMQEVSISDTIGKATPDEVAELLDCLLPKIPAAQLAVHFHDTYGQGIANVLKSVSCGIEVVDASAGGLGGCPFAPGATGNVATQAVVTALKDAGFPIDVDVKGLTDAGKVLSPYLTAAPPASPDLTSLACATCEFFDGRHCCGRQTRLS